MLKVSQKINLSSIGTGTNNKTNNQRVNFGAIEMNRGDFLVLSPYIKEGTDYVEDQMAHQFNDDEYSGTYTVEDLKQDNIDNIKFPKTDKNIEKCVIPWDDPKVRIQSTKPNDTMFDFLLCGLAGRHGSVSHEVKVVPDR